VAVALLVALATVHGRAWTLQSPVAAGLSRAHVLDRLAKPEGEPLLSYRAKRHMNASTRGGKMTADVDAWTALNDDRFTFDVVAETGSSLIRRKVLWAALEAEQKSQTPEARRSAALSEANYEFRALTAAPDRLLRLDIKPRRRHQMLVDGAVFFHDESADMVRVEGELSQRPSFWTRRVHVTREYGRIDGVRVPISMKSTADVLIAGTSTFAMTYEYVEINGRPVVGIPVKHTIDNAQ
jgi:hypothetical protein